MLRSIKSNNSPGHSHNRLMSVVDLSTDSCPGIILKRNNKMKKCNYCKNELTKSDNLKPYGLVWCQKCDQCYDKKVNVVKIENGVTFYGFSK